MRIALTIVKTVLLMCHEDEEVDYLIVSSVYPLDLCKRFLEACFFAVLVLWSFAIVLFRNWLM